MATLITMYYLHEIDRTPPKKEFEPTDVEYMRCMIAQVVLQHEEPLTLQGTCKTIETFERCREWRRSRGLYTLQCNRNSLPKDADTKRQIVFRGAGKRKTQEDVGQEEKETGNNEGEEKDTRSDFKKMFDPEKKRTAWRHWWETPVGEQQTVDIVNNSTIGSTPQEYRGGDNKRRHRVNQRKTTCYK